MTVTVSSILRFVVRPPPSDLVPPPVRLSSWLSKPDPKPSGPSPACPAAGKALGVLPYEPHPSPLPSVGRPSEGPALAKADSVGVETSECVVKALVVLAGPLVPVPRGLAAVTPFDGVASLATIWVCPLCIAGLPHGSLSRLSKESLRMRLDFEGVAAGVFPLVDGVTFCG